MLLNAFINIAVIYWYLFLSILPTCFRSVTKTPPSLDCILLPPSGEKTYFCSPPWGKDVALQSCCAKNGKRFVSFMIEDYVKVKTYIKLLGYILDKLTCTKTLLKKAGDSKVVKRKKSIVLILHCWNQLKVLIIQAKTSKRNLCGPFLHLQCRCTFPSSKSGEKTSQCKTGCQ